ncbi:MAG: zinc-ribbon domain-containing protein [Minicystis sp.]
MDVTCERCSTAYEFDDALVSERGTTVKCTNCGHQFKVRRAQAAGAPERWLVRTIDGRELEFRALRELQAAIAQALISRDDVLSRGGSRPRRLGSIAELEPFFASVAGGAQHSTNLGLGPKAPPRGRAPTPSFGGTPLPPAAAPSRPEVSVAIPLPWSTAAIAAPEDPPSVDDETQVMQHTPATFPGPSAGRRPSVPPLPPRRSNPPPGVVVSPKGAPPPPVIHEDATVQGSYDDATVQGSYDETTRSLNDAARVAAAELAREGAPLPRRTDDISAPTAPFAVGAVIDPAAMRALAQDDWNQAPADPPAAEPSEPAAAPVPSSPPSEPAPASAMPSNPALTPTPGAVRSSYGADDAYGEPRFSIVGSQRRSGAARWMVGVFVGGMVVLAFATIGRKMLVTDASPKGEADARVGALLADGEKSLTDGDLELAKEQFDKASVLAERDARVVADLARLAAAKADVDWLRVRLLAADDPEQAGARRELEQAVQRARRAADRAAEIAPADPGVARSRIDALRLAGELDGARKLVGAVSGESSKPENALVLAALDLAEARPDWSTVIGRLRTAVGGEGNSGRARALLVYALARSGDFSGAKAELERLKVLPRPHPLVGALTSYLARADKAVDVSALPDAPAKKPAAPVTAAPATAAPSPRDPAPPRDRPAPAGGDPKPPPSPAPAPEPSPTPVAPNGPIDTSDLPGVKAPAQPAPQPTSNNPAPPPPAPTNTTPPGVDTSDLPGFK